MTRVYIALGSNIEPRYNYLMDAILLLGEQETITLNKQSSVYETKPVGYTEQADFLNMVIEIDTSLSASQLLVACQAIEQQLGRKREIRFGPRTVDLDILLYRQEQIETKRLTIPHPRMHERAFVLVPLAEIAPDLKITGFNRTVSEMVKDLPAADRQGVVKWTPTDISD
ncbi:2-amino-4-hydroxy-6-hydroxymethyldihydropteridine diphosphokinase [Lentibacillus sp. L22]|uniref:2-amino-4-hydroxy-6- hydroxymethyldihydropteridine diphosphokinase n=1 Tax=Lentibacillus sp. L22 TaxID=3163028 RepID=UPI003467898A